MPEADQRLMPLQDRVRWFLRRVACAVYDGLILVALFMFATAILMPFTGGAIAPPPYNLPFDAYLLFIGVGYFILVWRRDGQTLGMRAWRLRLVKADGSRIDARTAIIRSLAGLAGWMALGLGWLWILVDGEGRGWQDIISRTRLERVSR